jgi:hypothetical protein
LVSGSSQLRVKRAESKKVNIYGLSGFTASKDFKVGGNETAAAKFLALSPVASSPAKPKAEVRFFELLLIATAYICVACLQNFGHVKTQVWIS